MIDEEMHLFGGGMRGWTGGMFVVQSVYLLPAAPCSPAVMAVQLAFVTTPM